MDQRESDSSHRRTSRCAAFSLIPTSPHTDHLSLLQGGEGAEDAGEVEEEAQYAEPEPEVRFSSPPIYICDNSRSTYRRRTTRTPLPPPPPSLAQPPESLLLASDRAGRLLRSRRSA